MGTRIHEALEVRDPSNLTSELEIELYDKCIEAEDKLIPDYFGDDKYTRYNELPVTVPLNSGLEIWGTGDVLCISEDGNRGLMIDYKSGRMKVDDAEVNLQARAYKNGAFEKFPDLQELRFIFLAPQLDLIDVHDFKPESVDIDRQIITVIVKKAMDYRERWADGSIMQGWEGLTTNENCTFCRHAQYCPAINGVLLDFAAATGIEVPDHIDMENLSEPDQVAELYTIAKLIEPLVDRIKKAAVELAHDGEVLPGWELRSMGSKRMATDNKDFWDYCASQGLGMDDLLEHINIPVAKFRDLVKDRAPKGEKTKAAKNFEEEAIDKGVIVFAKERFTLRPERADD